MPHTGQARLPLAGIRVLDFSMVWAGPMCTRALADLGAEVIKVEATTRTDPERGPAAGGGGRLYPGGVPGERPYNRAGRFNEYNRNKLGITLDLKHPEGRSLARELVRITDLVVENFSAGVLDRLGFGYGELVRLRPDVILLSMPGFGATGPEAHYIAYGPTQEAMSGLSSMTGYPDGPPLLTGIFFGDPVGGTFAAVAAVTALWGRRRTGRGGHIDLSQQEALASLLPEVLLEYQFNGRILTPQGNRHPAMAPHGCYPCKDEDHAPAAMPPHPSSFIPHPSDRWIVIGVEDEAQWQALCRLMDRPELAADPRFATRSARRRHQDELDGLIAAWTQDHDHRALMRALQEAGIAAEAVLNAAKVLDDPHERERGFFQDVPHPEAGTHPHAGGPWRFSGAFLPIRRAAPCLGEHNALVLGGLLGLSAETLEQLEAEGVIGTRPASGNT